MHRTHEREDLTRRTIIIDNLRKTLKGHDQIQIPVHSFYKEGIAMQELEGLSHSIGYNMKVVDSASVPGQLVVKFKRV